MRSKLTTIATLNTVYYALTLLFIIYAVITATSGSYHAMRSIQDISLVVMIIGFLLNVGITIMFYMLMPSLKQYNISSTGALLYGIANSLGLFCNLLTFAGAHGDVVTAIFVMFGIAAFVLCIVGASMLGKDIIGFHTVRAGYWVILSTIVVVLLFSLLLSNSQNYHTAETFGAIMGILALGGIITSVVLILVGYWKAASSARAIEAGEY